jgi:arylamine N-acetyltransferase
MKGLSSNLVNRVLARLNINAHTMADHGSLQSLYTAWCMHIPFDNIRKMIVLKSGNKLSLPGLNAEEFFENWLENGSGATCWPMANAFYELLIAMGYKATRIAGYMRDMQILNHGSVRVSIHNQEYLAEASLLLNVILPLGQETIIHNDPVCPVELEAAESSHLLWIVTPPNEEYFYCRMKSDAVDFSVFEERYEASRTTSVFNQRLYAKRNHPGRMVVLLGNARYSKTSNGIEHSELSREELCAALHRDIGISYSLINEWEACGGLDACFEKPSGSRPPANTLKPPSQRKGLE